jgi:hypothetical protein
MFGLGKRERAAEAIRRGTLAALTGGYFHHSQVEAFELNPEASAWLYTEGLAHQVYALGLIYTNTVLGNHTWATPQFFFESVRAAMSEHEGFNSLPSGSISSFVFPRLETFQNFDRLQLVAGKQFELSAGDTMARDPKADVPRITQALKAATDSYFDGAKRMFGL